MAKFGKKNIVKINPLAYNIGLFGESGIGKSTTAVEICEKLVGTEGYILLNMGKEDGVDAINGAIYENVPDWATYDEIISDIVENKDTDYKNLKVIVLDTIDELELMAQKEVIRLHNKMNPQKATKMFNATFGGFGAPTQKLSEIVLDSIWKLKSVGINVIVLGHIKRRVKNDVITGEEYDEVTAKISSRLFEDIKTKLHVLGLGVIRRDVEEKVVGEDIMGKNKTINVTKKASRVITFRDDSFTIDAKSRFADIVDKIPFNSDEFIKAITDAIQKSFDSRPVDVSIEDAEKFQKKEAEAIAKENIQKYKNESNYGNPEELVEKIKEVFKSDETKKQMIIDVMKGLEIKTFELLKDAKLEDIIKVYKITE